MQIPENQRIRILSLAQESGQARCKADSSGQNTRYTMGFHHLHDNVHSIRSKEE